MIGGLLGGIGGLIGGIGTFAGGLAQGIGTLLGGVTQFAGGVTQFAGEVIGAAPEIVSAVKPGVELWSQWERQRAEEDIIREGTKLQRERLEAEKQIALQQILLANRPAQPAQPVTYQIIPGQPVTAAPAQTAPAISMPMLGQAVSPKQDNTILILIVAAIAICFLLFMKK